MKGLNMSLKTILVFVDFSPSGEARTRYAVNLCLRHGAHLIGVYVAPAGWRGDRAGCYVRGQDAIRQLINQHKAEEAIASEAALECFKAVTRREDINFDFRIIRESDANEHAKLHSLHADLIIVGFPGPGGLPGNWSPEDMLLATGVPLLIVPDTWNPDSIAERILLGWNASREARRAITDSLPLLATAQSVSVVVVDSENNPRHGEEPGADVALYLSRHGAKVTVEHARSAGHSTAEVLQMAAKRNNSDLLVVGAYSHSRSRQAIFGGVTRALLANVTIPLLIAH
ncbi:MULTISPECIES: universal stress protein [unclassified Ensifer]|uniref:universal stress protein n=1 Tax=unclassified Ensifer TaxID=2633371 RepID=UPI000ABF880D|nr:MULTISPECIES: universal stress protein [unclassified Ensifer]